MEAVHEMLPESLAGLALFGFLFGFLVGALIAYGRVRRLARKEERA